MTDLNLSKPKTLLLLAGLAVLSFYFLLYGTGARTLWDPDEGRYAEMVREMLALGNWVTPHFNNAAHLDKPPLYLWLGSLSSLIFGLSEFSLRLVSALAGIGGIWITFLLGRRLFGFTAGLLSAAILVSSFGYIGTSRLISTDMTLCFWMTLSLYLLLAYSEEKEEKKRAFYWAGAYVAMGFGFLTKGLIAFFFPVAILLLYFLFTRQIQKLRELRVFKGLLLISAVALPWLILVEAQNKGFFYQFFIEQHLLRFLTNTQDRSEEILFPFLMTVAGFSPWAFFLPSSLIVLFRKRGGESHARPKELWFLIVWSLFILLFFTFSSSKLPTYIVPMFPPLAILVGAFWSRLLQSKSDPEKWEPGLLHFLLPALAAALITGSIFIFLQHRLPGSWRQAFIPALLVSFILIPPVLFNVRKNYLAGFVSILLIEGILLQYALQVTLPVMEQAYETRSAAQFLKQHQQPDDVLILFKPTKHPSVLFYSKSNWIGIKKLEQLLLLLENNKTKRLFVVMNRVYFQKHKNNVGNLTVIHDQGAVVLLSNSQITG